MSQLKSILKDRFKEDFALIKDRFKEDFALIDEILTNEVAITLVSIDKIDTVFDFNMFEVNDILENVYKYIADNIKTIEDFKNNEAGLLKSINEDITSIF